MSYLDDSYYIELTERKRLIAIVQKWRDKKHVGDMNPINILDDILKEMQ